jgi:Ca2+-binding EF-hand superfamily protein
VLKTVTLLAKVILPLGALAVTVGLVGAQDPVLSPQEAISTYDTDKDGTIDENEVKTAASATFDKLDVDKDGTLDEKELQGRLNTAQFREADPDNDKTLTKPEYIVFVTKAFKRANPDNDGTVDARELRTAPGRALLILMR